MARGNGHHTGEPAAAFFFPAAVQETRECPVGRVYKVFLMKKISQPTSSGADCDIPRKKNLYVLKCAVGHSLKIREWTKGKD
jgi:hypothetical protein